MELPNVLVKVAALIVRPLVLAAIAGVALAAFRVKSPAVRHAIWLQVVIGMLLLAVAAVVALPTLPVRILPPRATPAAALIVGSRPPVPIAPSRVSSAPRPRPFPWNDVLTAVYLVGLLVSTARLAFGLLLARRLVGRARRLANFAGERVLASDAISVPMTLGWFRPVILLPSGWDKWPEDKLQAVMVHERTHVARGDWAVGLLASVNRCVFWFHPLAWWLERHLRLLAEFACDDASLAQVPSRDKYAEVLVEMAAAVGRRDRRVAWEAMAMARHSDVHHRVERVLDEARVLCLGLTRAHRVALALCALPVLYLVAAIRPARVYAQQALAPAAPAAVEFRPQAPAPTEMRPPAPVEAGPSAESATAAQDRLYELYLRADRLGSARAELEKRLAASAEAQEAKWQAQGQRSALLEQLNKQILILRAEIEDMSSELSPNHPSLKRAEASLAVLERNSDQARREAEVSRSSELRNALPISVLSSELQSIREQLAATERVMESVDREAQAVRSHMAATEQTLVAERRMHDAGISDGRTSGSSPTGSMAAAGLYSQVMAVSQDVALAMQQALRQRGFPVSLVPAGNLMRVLAGPYPDAPARQIARRDLEAAGFKPVPFQRD